MSLPPAVAGSDVKACCAAFYGGDWARLLIGDSMHPGGVDLTLRLGEMLQLGPADRVLDLAAARGVSARALANRFGCQVVGIDLSAANVDAARLEAGESDRLAFQVGDAEALAFNDEEFDAVICECAFCTFPDKSRAAAEMARVLRPIGRVGVSDLVRRRDLPAKVQTLAAWVACIADARPEAEYIDYLTRAGFVQPAVEVHDVALAQLAKQIRLRLLAANIAKRFGKLELPATDLDIAVDLARMAEQAIHDRKLGYVLFTATTG